MGVIEYVWIVFCVCVVPMTFLLAIAGLIVAITSGDWSWFL